MRLLMALALPLLALPATSQAASLRCGTDLVADGATKADVLLKCGEPMTKESRTESTEVKTKAPDGDSVKQIVHKNIEEWTYNFGAHRFMQVVIFENGRLVDVRSTSYGR